MHSHPRNKINKNFLETTIKSRKGNIIWMGDLNSHNPVWGNQQYNSNGRILAEIIGETNLVITNDGAPTRL